MSWSWGAKPRQQKSADLTCLTEGHLVTHLPSLWHTGSALRGLNQPMGLFLPPKQLGQIQIFVSLICCESEASFSSQHTHPRVMFSKRDSSPCCCSSCLLFPVTKATSSARPSAAWTLWSRCLTVAVNRTWSTLLRTSTFCSIWVLQDRVTRRRHAEPQRTWWRVKHSHVTLQKDSVIGKNKGTSAKVL